VETVSLSSTSGRVDQVQRVLLTACSTSRSMDPLRYFEHGALPLLLEHQDVQLLSAETTTVWRTRLVRLSCSR
jgi:hypothetical protein